MGDLVGLAGSGTGYSVLQGSGTSAIGITLFAVGEPVVTVNGRVELPPLPSFLDGKKVSRVQVASNNSPVGSGSTIVQIHNLTTALDILSVGASLPAGANIGTQGLINPNNSTIHTDDRLRVDITQVASPVPLGLGLIIEIA